MLSTNSGLTTKLNVIIAHRSLTLVRIVSDPLRAAFNFNSQKATVANIPNKRTITHLLGFVLPS
jgi:hypothetical protein